VRNQVLEVEVEPGPLFDVEGPLFSRVPEMVGGGEIVIRPMMYISLSYDHRIIDGKGAVTFLVRVKEMLEDPRRLLMDL
jgi:pyruvate/2-oxoglutarate dehydrogenase complex dihydrolipoamide acyltransferase (E2) component